MRQRINKRYNSERQSLVNKRLMIQQHQSEVSAIDAKQKGQRTLFWLVAAGLISLAGLFLRLYQLSQLRRQQERMIEAEKEKSFRLEKQLVDEELSRAKDVLAGFMDNLIQKDALIDAITAQLADRAPTESASPNAHPTAETRQNLVNSSLLTNDDWDEFRRRFERVHPGFFWQLKTQFSDLSPAEERLLALSKLKIDSRQMSRMLGISPESIRKTRYRLRKKLGIQGDSPLLKLLSEPQDTLKSTDGQ
jgi:DNA-binding CsgD family transcriptional regulator